MSTDVIQASGRERSGREHSTGERPTRQSRPSGHASLEGRVRTATPREATTPEATTPEATTPEATTPEATTPEATTPEATTPEATTPEATTPKEPTKRAATVSEPVARRPRGAAALLLASPAAALVLLAGARDPMLDLAGDGRIPALIGALAVGLLANGAFLAVRAAVLGLHGRHRGTDLAALALLAAMSSCVLLFVAGVRLDFLAWGVGLLITLAGGFFGLDAASSACPPSTGLQSKGSPV